MKALVPLLLLTACAATASEGTVGAVFLRDRDTHTLLVKDAPVGGAAANAGLEAGDEVVMIDGFYTRELSSKDVRVKLRGEVGSTVRLTVVRKADEVHHIVVTRAERGERHPPPPREERISE
jgi:carboxyl-terminal processing protease